MPFWPLCCESEAILSKNFRPFYPGWSVHMEKCSSRLPRSRFFDGPAQPLIWTHRNFCVVISLCDASISLNWLYTRLHFYPAKKTSEILVRKIQIIWPTFLIEQQEFCISNKDHCITNKQQFSSFPGWKKPYQRTRKTNRVARNEP